MAAGDWIQVLQKVSQSADVAQATWTHAGVAIVEAQFASGQPFFAAAIFTAEILPRLSSELINLGRCEFHVPCHLCGGAYLIRLRQLRAAHAGSLTAVCPHCGRMIDVFGIDSAQQYHRPPWFLRGFYPARIENPLEAWRQVLTQIQYVKDETHYGRAEVWQLAQQTYRLQRGDCEDTAILLADWLAATGHQARVVLGEQSGVGHAWVVLRTDSRHYILETTGGIAVYRKRPLLSATATGYLPRIQFDRTGIWYRTSDDWTPDYSSHEQWKPGPWP